MSRCSKLASYSVFRSTGEFMPNSLTVHEKAPQETSDNATVFSRSVLSGKVTLFRLNLTYQLASFSSRIGRLIQWEIKCRYFYSIHVLDRHNLERVWVKEKFFTRSRGWSCVPSTLSTTYSRSECLPRRRPTTSASGEGTRKAILCD